MSSRCKLFTSWFCPFAQRVWIALLEKNISFEYIEIDPYDKTPEFLAINPRGLVPTLVNNGKSVYESYICLEYIDENWPQKPQLMPSDTYERAFVRIWADFISKRITRTFYKIFLAETSTEVDEEKKTLLEHLQTLTQAMSSSGPYFMGDKFGVVDIMLLPFTLRFDVLQHYRNFELPADEPFKRLHQWMQACHKRASVTPTVPAKEKLIAIYKKYSDGTAKSQVAEAIKKGKPLP